MARRALPFKHAKSKKAPTKALCGAALSDPSREADFVWARVNCQECRKRKRPSGDQVRFWLKVDKNGPMSLLGTQCWVWVGSRHHAGYGDFWLNRKAVKSHRYSYELHHGPVPAGMFVMHLCDNTTCVNPAHLKVGTAKENSEDCQRKGRIKGTHKRLTAAQRNQIKVLQLNGVPIATIATRMRTTRATVWRWVRGYRANKKVRTREVSDA